MQNLIFTTLTFPGKSEMDTLMLAESLRRFGGRLADNPLWVLVPTELGSLSDSTQKKLGQLEAEIIPFNCGREYLNFPFAVKVLAGAFLEEQANGKAERLVYMDRDTIILQEPAEFLITPGQILGYRPVHHKLIGSTWDQPLDPFWKLVYEVCDAPDKNLFPMMTHVGECIRPYFNAGVYIIRPEYGLLSQWRDLFLQWYIQPQFKVFYEKDQLYIIFIHQAIFTGVLLQNLEPDKMYELSPEINYPLHLYNDIPLDQRPAAIDELVTVRHESIFDRTDWRQFPISTTLKKWLETQPRLQKSTGGTR